MRARVEPLYRPSGKHDEIVLYAGDFDVKADDKQRTVRGYLELRLAAGPALIAHFAGPPSEDLYSVSSPVEPEVSVSVGAPLMPSTDTALPEMPGEAASWIDAPIRIRNELVAGDVASSQRFIFHISGALMGSFPTEEVIDGAYQCRLGFRLAGWDLVIAPVDDPGGEHDFTFVVEATPASSRHLRPEPPSTSSPGGCTFCSTSWRVARSGLARSAGSPKLGR